jgi:hypothetical protein
MRAVDPREAILLVGETQLRRILDVIAASAVFTATQPIEAIWNLVRHAATLHTVVVASTLPWREELAALLASEYPEIRLVVVAQN